MNWLRLTLAAVFFVAVVAISVPWLLAKGIDHAVSLIRKRWQLLRERWQPRNDDILWLINRCQTDGVPVPEETELDVFGERVSEEQAKTGVSLEQARLSVYEKFYQGESDEYSLAGH